MNKKLKITHLTCAYPPYKGGIGSVAQKYSQIAVNNGYNVSIYTPNYQKNGHIEEKNEQITICRLKPKLALGNAAIIPLKNYLKDTDILHIHYPFYGSVIPAILKFKKNPARNALQREVGGKKPIILSWHMNPSAQGIKGFIFKLYELIITPWIFKQVDKILVSTKDYFSNESLFQKYKNKIKELPFSVNTKKFKPQEKNYQLFQKYKLENKKVLIFVGGLDRAHYFKGINILLKTLQKLSKEYLLMIIGEGELRKYYKKSAEKLKIDDRVIFTGGIKDEDLIIYYNLADALVLPSINQGEAFGIVQLEAMACGKPVIVSNLPGVRTVLKENETGFVFENKNIDDLAKKINKLFSDAIRYQEFCHHARQRVLNHFSDQVISKKLIQIYKKVISKK